VLVLMVQAAKMQEVPAQAIKALMMLLMQISKKFEISPSIE
jgi:hypothetical protein